jgi:formiminoglutamase
MKDISIYLSPFTLKDEVFKNSFGANVSHFTESINLSEFDLVLLGVEEERGTNEHSGCGSAPDKIRQQLYALTYHFKNFKILDLGNVKAGESLEDTHYAVSEIVTELVKNDCVVVILGGSQDLTYANYKAYENLEQIVNLLSIDPKIDIDKMGEGINDKNYINYIITHQPNYLFNYTNIGYQTYFVDTEILDLVDEMYFDAERLGKVREKIIDAEPMLRTADIVSLDISSVRNSDLPGCKIPSPNGFYGEEICQLARFSGLSDQLSSFGLYNYNPAFDFNNTGAMLCAQIIWYFIDGVYHREKDYPIANKDTYLKYIVNYEGMEDMIFYKSPKTSRWWMEAKVPKSGNSRYSKQLMIPCSYEDYLLACNGDVPERLIAALKKVY